MGSEMCIRDRRWPQWYYGSVGVGKLVNMGGYQVVNGPSTLHNVLEIMNSKRKLVRKD